MRYTISFHLEEAKNDNPIWAVVETDQDELDTEQLAREVLALEYGANHLDLTWLETAEYYEDPDQYLNEHPAYSGVWL